MKNYGFPAALVVLTLISISGNAVAQTGGIIGGDMGTYRIHANVEGARVYFDADYKGEITNGILDVPVYVTGTPYQTYTLEMDGYKTYTGYINSVPAKGQVMDIYVKLTALPIIEYGTIHLLVTPTLSTVYFDGAEAGRVPPDGIFIIYNIVPGNHSIQISKEGFTTLTIEQNVMANDIVKVPVTLEAISSGSLSVSSNPSGAQIFLDGENMGVTPLTLPSIAEGQHSLLLQLAGYSDYNETVTVTPGETSVSATLIPALTASGRIGLSPLALLGALAATAFLMQKRT
jgi:hypothetical protein